MSGLKILKALGKARLMVRVYNLSVQGYYIIH